MIAQHAALARALAEQLGLPEPVLESLGAAYEQWDGRGLARRARAARDVPIAARLAQLAEFIEVAHRVGGVEAAQGDGGAARRQAVRPGPRRPRAGRGRDDPRRASTRSGPGTR